LKVTEHFSYFPFLKHQKVLMLRITYLDVSFGGISIFSCDVIQIKLVFTWLSPSLLHPSVRPCAAIERLENHRTDLHQIWYWEFYRKLSRHLSCGQTRTNTKKLYMDTASFFRVPFSVYRSHGAKRKKFMISLRLQRKKFILMYRYIKH
jgi:hypothetical protein